MQQAQQSLEQLNAQLQQVAQQLEQLGAENNDMKMKEMAGVIKAQANMELQKMKDSTSLIREEERTKQKEMEIQAKLVTEGVKSSTQIHIADIGGSQGQAGSDNGNSQK
jgi:phage shock protein A